MNLSTIPAHNEEVYYHKVENEGLLIHGQKGKVRTMNFVGDFIWNLIDGQKSVAQIVEQVKSEFNVQVDTIKSDVFYYLQELSDRSLIYLREE
ncbi:MAG: PqqD family protein [Anaerolineaceae bacterium]|nr:PqqD family protein [Anaerolineaceae bacterium]